MAHTVKESPQPVVPAHVRREELVRPTRGRREFTKREAQRRLVQKESTWTPVAYGVFLGAILIIFSITYMTFAFSKYRGHILPGVTVDTLPVGGLTQKQAVKLIDQKEAAIGRSPVRLVYGPFPGAWEPSPNLIGLHYKPEDTAKQAMNVGRTGPFISQLIDRLPLHPVHSVPLVYTLDPGKLEAYLKTIGRTKLHLDTNNAAIVPIKPANDDFTISSARSGIDLDLPAAIDSVHSILGSLTKQTRALKVIRITPAISNADARVILKRVKRFLANPPILSVGKRVIVTTRKSFAPMLRFDDKNNHGHWSIVMTVNTSAMQAYVSGLAAQIDRPSRNARMVFRGGRVDVAQPRQEGRSLDQQGANAALLKVVSSLEPTSRLHFKVSVSQPPIDATNPASLGITRLIGEGTTSFPHAGDARLSDVTSIARALDNTVISPNQEISFNTLVGTNWYDRMYDDHETSVLGGAVPADTGAMQQVATTFLRALFAAGLKVVERHPHPYRLDWYEPPVGLDAVVLPGRNWDLRFANTTHKYLLIETRVEPIRQQLYIYVYGPNLKWKILVDKEGKINKLFRHPRTLRRQDPTLAPGEIRQIAFAHDGANTAVQRTITFPNGRVIVDEIDTHYRPWQAIMSVGMAPTPAPTATPQAASHHNGNVITPTPTAPLPTPSPTATP